MNTADQECSHAFNKRFAGGSGGGVEHMAAVAVLQRTKTIYASFKRAATPTPSTGHTATASKKPRVDQSHTRVYNDWGVLQLFHWKRAHEHMLHNKACCVQFAGSVQVQVSSF